MAAQPYVTPAGDAVTVRSHLVGRVAEIKVPSAGVPVKKGQPLCVLKLLGTEHQIHASRDGLVLEVHARQDSAVGYGDPLISLR